MGLNRKKKDSPNLITIIQTLLRAASQAALVVMNLPANAGETRGEALSP